MVIKSGPIRGINPYIVFISLSVMLIFMLYTLFAPEHSAQAIDKGRTFITFFAGKWYVILAAFFLIFCIFLGFSKYGKIRLGDDNERPEFSNFAWFAMLYAAGQGIGIIFWSIAEPMFHFASGTPFNEAKGTQEAAEAAMQVSFFHWGLNAWAFYCVVGVSLAFVSYRLKKPLSIRYTLYPLLGEKVNGPIGVLVDVIAVFATLFGIATSLGLGVQQINAGISAVSDIPQSLTVQLILIVVISAFALMSVMSGLKRGIKYFSITNMCLTFVMLAFFLFLGPTVYIVKLLVTSTFDYFAGIVPMNAFFEPVTQSWGQEDASWKSMWQGWWSVFYWGWWISWAPFVGVFIARVSRGRTIREFIFGVVGVSSLLSFVWLAAYGGTALYLDLEASAGIAKIVQANVADALYATIAAMDVGVMGYLATIASTILVSTYFITSSDSGTLVLTTIMSEGNENPLTRHRVFWGVIQGSMAAVLLTAGGSAALSTLQTASIATALPFSALMVLMCIALIKGLHTESKRMATA